MGFSIGFEIAMTIVIFLNILIIIPSFKQKDLKGKYLGITCIFEILTGVFYTISAVTKNYVVFSIFSSLYFICIDGLILSFLAFVVYWGKPKNKKIFKIATIITKLYAFYEAIIFIINIFSPIAIDYTRRGSSFMHFAYVMKPLYYMHLGYSYFVVIAVVSILVFNLIKVPKEYRSPYRYLLATLIIVIIINGLFLFLPKEQEWALADYSVLCYFIGSAVCYWACYIFPKTGMLNHFKSSVFQNINQGIVLYDYNDNMLLYNNKAESFFFSSGVTIETPLEEFLHKCNLTILDEEDAYSLQCFVFENGKQRPLRCDYRVVRNDKNDIIGRLFVFADAQLDTDLLTGFHNWESFRKFAIDNGKNFPNPTVVCVCDINRLSVYNTVYGRQAGDDLLKDLAKKMRAIFPDDTYYVRGQEAYFIAICYNKTEENVTAYCEELTKQFKEKFQYSLDRVLYEDENLLSAMLRVFAGLRAKKLLDSDSSRSSLLSSLLRALRDCDPDTEAHVKRTRKLGDLLGKRLELSELEKSRLSLLCLIHDIGKISIPSSVINKTTKLNDEDWYLIKAHSVKGQSIVEATPELKSMGKEIRHHHERWDGKGYPDGLSRESIPLLSRVIGVIDAFDAMVSERPYRPAKSFNEAKEELIKNAGTQFDPRIVEEFIDLLEYDISIDSIYDSKTAPRINEVNEKKEEQSNHFIYPIIYSKYILNQDLKITEIDEEFTHITGYTKDDIKNNEIHQRDLLPQEDRFDYGLEVEKQLRTNSIAYIEHKLLCKNGSLKTVYCFGRKYFDSVERIEKSEIIIVNSTTTYAAKLLAKSIEDKSAVKLKEWENTFRRDSLTGLLTHMAFVNDLKQKRFECPELKSILIMMDLDNFKKFNDTYGHHAGDEFLIQIGQVLNSVIKNHDLACRMGGDEFMLAIFIKPEDDYRAIATKIFDKISMQLSLLEKSTTFSVGVAVNDGSFKNFDEQYEAVDKVMYESKNTGKNRLCFYEDFKNEGRKK